RVSAIPPRRRIHRRRGAAHTPKTQFADRDRHFPEQCPWNESLPAPTWRAMGSSFDTRSGYWKRQSIRKRVVSNCLTYLLCRGEASDLCFSLRLCTAGLSPRFVGPRPSSPRVGRKTETRVPKGRMDAVGVG